MYRMPLFIVLAIHVKTCLWRGSKLFFGGEEGAMRPLRLAWLGKVLLHQPQRIRPPRITLPTSSSR